MDLKVNQQEGVWKNESNYKIKEVKNRSNIIFMRMWVRSFRNVF